MFDVNEFKFEIKEDLFGLGYKRLDVDDIFNRRSQIKNTQSTVANILFPEMTDRTKSKKKTITGQVLNIRQLFYHMLIKQNKIILFEGFWSWRF